MKMGKDEYGVDMIIVDNEDDADLVLEAFERLRERAAKVATQLIALEHGQHFCFDADEITAEGTSLYANWWTSCCGDSEDHQTPIPLNYLFDEDWQAEAEATIQRKRELEAKNKQLREEKAKKAAQERERKRYLELKAKYEGDS